jgi:WD40 repeat protein
VPAPEDAARALALSADGKVLAMGGDEGTVRVWDAAVGKERFTLKGHVGVIKGLAFSSDGKLLASGDDKGVLRLWDATTGEERVRADAGLRGVAVLTHSPDGKTLAIGGTTREWEAGDRNEYNRPGEVRLWDVGSAGVRQTLRGFGHAVTSVAFAPDGKTLAVGSDDKTIRLWDAVTGKELAVLNGKDESVSAVTFSPDGKQLAAGYYFTTEGTVALWDVAARKEAYRFTAHRRSVYLLAYQVDGKALISAGDDGVISFWDRAELRENKPSR